MWLIGFFSILLVAVIAYAGLAKNRQDKQEYPEDEDPEKTGGLR
jgi:hypothetical protein